MTSTAEVIILSSSPSPKPQTPVRCSYVSKKPIELSPLKATPPPLPSPPELVEPTTHSRFFSRPDLNDFPSETDKHQTTRKSESAQKNAASKPRKQAKSVTKEPQTSVLGDLEPGALNLGASVVKKPRACPKDRSRSEKSKKSVNLTLSGKVTKSRSASSTKLNNTKKIAAPSQTPSEISSERTEVKKSNVLNPGDDLLLDKAMSRRTDWTPPKNNASTEIMIVENAEGIERCKDGNTNSFGNLLSNYNFPGSSSDLREVHSVADSEGPTKRRKIELVNPQCQPLFNDKDGQNEDSSSSNGPSKKRKAKSQKRFTTLTARMTAQYTSVADDDASVGEVEESARPLPKRRKPRPEEQNTPFIVLSPEAAAKTLDEQDLIFGTCSQLERDDSPETLREMQRAIRESEAAALEAKDTESVRAPSRPTGTRNLWCVAARDAEGSLVQAMVADTVDLTGTEQASKHQTRSKVDRTSGFQDDDVWFDLDYGKSESSNGKVLAPLPKRSGPAVDSQPPICAPAQSVSNIQDVSVQMASIQSVDSQQTIMPQYSGFTNAELSKQVAAYGFKSVRNRKKMIELLEKCWESKTGSGRTLLDTQLEFIRDKSKSAASSQAQSHTTTTQEMSQNAEAKRNNRAKSTQSVMADPVPRGSRDLTEPANQAGSERSTLETAKRARASSASYLDVDEIQDSEDEIIPSPSRIQQRYTELLSATRSAGKPSLDFQTKEASPSPKKHRTGVPKVSRPVNEQSSTPTFRKDRSTSRDCNAADIFPQITHAVRAQSQSSQLSISSSKSSRSRPTWHEKILMYDPIVLEDFTKWLNVEGLGLVGEDQEVAPSIVREWCETKGICCCWKNASW